VKLRNKHQICCKSIIKACTHLIEVSPEGTGDMSISGLMYGGCMQGGMQQTFYKTNVAMWYNKTCRLKQLTPTTSAVKEFHSTLQTRQSSVQNNKYQVSHKYSCSSWWWAHSRPKHVEKRNKHTKKNCAPSWLYFKITQR